MKNVKSTIAVFALQGAFIEHQAMMEKLGANVLLVRSLADVENKKIDGVILPGGESTTMTKMLKKTGLGTWLKKQGEKGLPIFGTCAGMILLADMELIDIEVDRNAYGGQLFSFETDIALMSFPTPIGNLSAIPLDPRVKPEDDKQTKYQKLFNGIFIRAPKIKSVGKGIKVLAKHGDVPVLVQQKNILTASFHPELTEDGRIHEFFLAKILRGI